MEPDDGAPELRGFGESVPVGGERDAEARRGEVVLKTRGEGGMGRDRGDVGDDVFGADLCAVLLRQKGEQRWAHVGTRGFRVAPERKDAAAATVVVMQVGNQAR